MESIKPRPAKTKDGLMTDTIKHNEGANEPLMSEINQHASHIVYINCTEKVNIWNGSAFVQVVKLPSLDRKLLEARSRSIEEVNNLTLECCNFFE